MPRTARHAYATPLTILGSKCVFWVKMNQFTVATGVSAILDLAKGSAQNVVQATTTKQPATYGISSVTGCSFVKGDGVDDQMTAVLSSTIAAGARPWLWLVYRATTTTSSIPVALHNSGDNLESCYLVNDSAHFRWGMISAGNGAGVDVTSNVFDTNIHLHECGWPATTVGRYVLDGVPFNSADSTGTFRNIDTVTLCFFKSGGTPSNFNNGELSEVVLADSLPNSDQFALMRDYFRRSYSGSGLAIA